MIFFLKITLFSKENWEKAQTKIKGMKAPRKIDAKACHQLKSKVFSLKKQIF